MPKAFSTHMPKATRTARHVGNFYQETLTKFAFLLFIMSYKICTVENLWKYISVNLAIDFKIDLLDAVLTLFVSSVSMAERSRAYVYDCWGATKTSLHLNLLATYEKEISPSTKTQ